MMLEPIAKGGDERITLKQHSIDVLECAEKMVSALEPYLSTIDPMLTENIRRGALYHDIGKAASGMQHVLIKGGQWGYRHEILSAAVLMAAGFGKRYPLALAAILTHHKALNDSLLADHVGAGVGPDQEDYFLRQWSKRVGELSGHWGWVSNCLKKTDKENGQEMAERLPPTPKELKDIRAFYRELQKRLENSVHAGLSSKALPYVAARGVLMAADHLASSGIGAPLIELKAKDMPLRRFQRRLSEHRGSAILEAPTGSGKTRAAIAWALANRRCGERIFYVLPYQASINAMARTLAEDSGFGFGEEAVGIVHHRALLQEFRRYFDEESDNYQEAARKAQQRMDQTRQFYRPIKIITPYQILRLFFGCRRFELGIAEMLGGIVIFDEIHAYDAHVAALIDETLPHIKALGVRFMFMSATFPEFLLERLEGSLESLQRFGIEGNDRWETELLQTSRHRLIIHDCSLEDLVPQIVRSAENGTVLVACNRIEQAKRMFDIICAKIPSTCLLHGGFTARDRYEKEKDLLASPDSMWPNCRVLVSTQVIEVSLNISFDTIFTEIAPVDDLLQRFGRVNRMNELGHPVDVHVASQFDADKVKWIYEPERLATTLSYAPQNCCITPKVESRWINDVYSCGFLPKEKSKYDLVRESFRRVIDNLHPLHDGDDREFDDLFSSVHVLPASLLAEYQNALEQGRYLEASQLLMSLPIGTFKRLENESAIESIKLNGKRNADVLVVKRRYDPEIGLTDEPETISASIY